MIRRRVVVHGRVQGVFFRDTLSRMARQRRVAGWVTNNPDGTVEAVLEGDESAVLRLIDWLHEGPRGAEVDKVGISEEEPEDLQGFAIR